MITYDTRTGEPRCFGHDLGTYGSSWADGLAWCEEISLPAAGEILERGGPNGASLPIEEAARRCFGSRKDGTPYRS